MNTSKLRGIAGRIKHRVFDGYAVKTYSQEGEDMILRRIFSEKINGLFVDVGAHHPKRFSNTYYFYKRGWSGINIDAMPGSMRLFDLMRPRDINLEVPVGTGELDMVYHVFDETALNSFDATQADKVTSNTNTNRYKLKNKIHMKAKTLESVLDEALPKGAAIDFLTIDTEGRELDVVRSNNWQKHRPDVVLLEVLGSTWQGLASDDAVRHMKNNGYEVFAKTFNTVFLRQHENGKTQQPARRTP